MSTDNKAAPHVHHHAHHFDSAEHEYLASKFGIWLFLATEILMFGGLFVGYIIYHGRYPDVFLAASKHTNPMWGAINTAVLLTSSLTMALGIYFIQKNKRDKAVINLCLTILCGFGFMTIKYIEYSHKIHLGLLPGYWFHGNNEGFVNMPLYFSFYYTMTGIHGLHVFIGMALIAWVTYRTQRGDFDPHYYTAVEGVGLFWHLVDLIWIYLFPLLYLVE